jgi:hypothetical protein
MGHTSESKRIDIRTLKGFAVRRLPRGSALRELLLIENDRLTVTEFLDKLDVWLKLLKMEKF